MKTLVQIFITLCIAACTGTKEISTERYSFPDITMELKDEYTNVIPDIKASKQALLEGVSSRSIQESPFFSFFASMDDYAYYRIPLYQLNLSEFYKNPTEENIQKCIHPSNILNILAEKEGNVDMRILASQYEGKWRSELTTQEYGKTIDWLRDSLYQAGTKEYKIFTVIGREWVTYNKDGEPRYFRITGQEFTPAKFCEYLVEEHKRTSNIGDIYSDSDSLTSSSNH